MEHWQQTHADMNLSERGFCHECVGVVWVKACPELPPWAFSCAEGLRVTLILDVGVCDTDSKTTALCICYVATFS